MKLKSVFFGLAMAVPVALLGQPAVMGVDAPGFLERGRLMLEWRNYVGVIDQSRHAMTLDVTVPEQERAEYNEALAMFERGEAESLDALQEFVDAHPSSPLAEEARLKIGNYYFYRGEWESALVSYGLVRDGALDADSDEDLLYRRAYCNLRLANYDEAARQYGTLSRTARYGAASAFYNAYIAYARGNYAEARRQFSDIAMAQSGELPYQAQYYITQIDYHNKNYRDVIKSGEKLLEEENNDYFDAELNRLVGESYYHTGDKGRARTYLQRYLDNPEGEPYRTATYTMGVLDYEAGNYDSALSRLTQSVGEDDALAQSAYLYMGQCRLKKNDLNGAARAFEQAAKMTHDANVRETAFYNYAISQNQGGRTPFDQSIDMLEQFLNDYPRSRYKDNVEGYLVDAYMSTSDYSKALSSINHIKNPGSKVLKAKQTVLYNLGVQSLANGKNADAINYLQQAVSLGNQDKAILNESRLWLAEAQYRTGDYKSAASNQQAYVKNATAKENNYGLAQYNLGYSLYQQKSYKAARTAFQNAVKSGQLPADLLADAHSRIGDTNYYLQDYTAAQASYDEAVKADKTTGGDYAMFQKGVMMGLAKDYAAEVTQLDAFLKAYPKSQYAPQAMLEKGNALAAADRGQDAVTAYNALLKAYPKSVEARKGLLQMAIVDKNLNNENAAIEAYKRVIKDYPSSDEAQAAAEDMKLLMADRGELADFERFLNSVPNAPRIDVSEVDRLTFEAAEKLAIADKPSITKMQNYLSNYPNGAYAPKAKYYIGRYYYSQNKLGDALTSLDDALKGNSEASFAEDAMAMRADILMRQGKKADALKAYQDLADRSSSADNRTTAQLGLLRAAQAMGNWDVVTTTATDLMKRGGLTAAEEQEVKLARALADVHLNNVQEAVADLKSLAANPKSEAGAQAAYELANLQLSQGNLKDAERTVNNLIDAGTPHNYWLAKSFIVLSDVYRKQGKTDEARDYLLSLKSNYPGKEQEIFDEIEKRLKNLKNDSGATSKKSTTNKKSKK
ncbi:MAG: tetratricopeptide repeat protein [Muribaculaceae bacterium]|nr:tetratricopeptide repeat protein [Muribaculaceae bacterium]